MFEVKIFLNREELVNKIDVDEETSEYNLLSL